MPKNLPTFRKVGMLVFPLVIIILAFSYYFFIYIKNKEKTVTERTYRILENANETIESKIDFYKDRIKNETVKINGNTTAFGDRNFSIKINSAKDSFLIEYIEKEDTNSSNADISLEELFTDISDNNYFEGLILAEVLFNSQKDTITKILYSTYKKSDFLEGQLIYALRNKKDLAATVNLESEDYKLFLHNVRDLGNDSTKYLIGGLIKEDRLIAKHRAIPSSFLLFFSIVFILLIFSYPFLKLLLIGPLERITIFDILLIVTSLIISTSIITVTFWEIYNYYVKYSYRQEKALREITTGIMDAFTQEVQDAVAELDSFKTSKTYEAIITTVNNKNLQEQQKTRNLYALGQSYLKSKKKNYQYDRIAGAGRDGIQLFKFNVDGDSAVELFHIKNRTYFKDIINKRYWQTDNENESLNNFALQSVLSWTDSSKSMLISIPAEAPVSVLHISSQPYSLTNTIMPENIQFCIINATGDVLFHSDIRKSLQENFLIESNNNPGIVSALFARKSTITHINYLEEDHTALITPIKSWPIFLVVFQNNRYAHLLSTEVVTLCLKFTFMKFLVAMTLIFLQTMQFPKKKKLKFNGLQFEWLRPDAEKKVNYKKGILYLIYSLLVISSLVWVEAYFYKYNNLQTIICLFFLFPLHIFLALYICLNDVTYKNFNNPKFLSFLIPIGIVIVFFSTGAFLLIETDYYFLILIFQLFMLAPLIWIGFPRQNIYVNKIKLKKRISFHPPSNYMRVYRGLIILWIITSTIIPHLMLYAKILAFETELTDKHDLLKTAKKIVHKKASLEEEKTKRQFSTNFPLKGIYNITIDSVSNESSSEKPNFDFNDILAKLRLNYDSVLVQQNGMLNEISNDSWVWKQKAFMEYDPKISSVVSSNKVLQVSKNNYDKELTIFELYFVISFFLFLIILYQILKFFIYKIFIVNLFSNKINCTSYESNIGQLLEEHKCVYVVDVFNTIRPLTYNASNTYYLNDHILFSKFRKSLTDIKNENLEKELDDEIERLLQNTHFIHLFTLTFNINNSEGNFLNLMICQKLVEKSRKVLIVSAIHPIQILRSYSKALLVFENNPNASQYAVLCDKWSIVLKYFYTIYNHEDEYLKTLGIAFSKSYSEDSKKLLLTSLDNAYQEIKPRKKRRRFKPGYNIIEFRNELLNTIHEESRHSNYLTDLADPLYRYCNEIIRQYLKIKKYTIPFSEIEAHIEEIIVKFQNMAQVYYSSLWNNCSSEEKHILYDLAEDELVNSKNIYIIQNLLSKGLIKEVHGLEIMNLSFRNYILTIIEPAEALAMEKEVSKRSTWPVINTLIVIVLFSLGVFLLMTQKDMNKTIGMITAFITSVPVIIKLFTTITEVKSQNAGK